MAQEKTKKQDILDAALNLSASEAWDQVSLLDIAQEAGVDPADITSMFPQKSDIVLSLLQRLDDEILAENFRFDLERDGEKDRLFEIIMFRFDLLEEQRAGYHSMLESLHRTPEKAWRHKREFCYAMRLMLEKAEIECHSVMKEDMLIAALSLVYIVSVKAWMKDDSPDLAKTMSVVDKNLTRMFQFSGGFGDIKWPRKSVWSEE